MSPSSESFLETLYWCLFSPDLIRLDSKSLDLDFLQKGWETSQSSLVDEERSPTFKGRLGHYFEDFIDFFLRHHPEVSCLQRGRQVKKGNQTIGEADFLFFEQSTGHWVHLEVAIKFYLYTTDGALGPNKASQFLGPNVIDNLQKKRDKLIHKQIKLIENNRLLVPDIPFDAALKPKLLFKGILFYPPSQQPISKKACLRIGISPEHTQGTWMRKSQIDGRQLKDTQYFFLDRSSWFKQPSLDEIDSQVLNPNEFIEFIQHHFKTSTQPLMFDQILTSPNGHYQRLRTLIVDEEWPQFPNLHQCDF